MVRPAAAEVDGLARPVAPDFVHRLFLPGERRRWYLQDVGRPAAVASSVAGVGWLLVPRSLGAGALVIAIALVFSACALATARAVPAAPQGYLRCVKD